MSVVSGQSTTCAGNVSEVSFHPTASLNLITQFVRRFLQDFKHALGEIFIG